MRAPKRLFLAATGLAAAVAVTFGASSGSVTGVLPVQVVSESASSITLAWTPPAGITGYVFRVDGARVSNTWDAARSSVRFQKIAGGSHTFEVVSVAESVGGSVTYPAVTPPPPPPPPPPSSSGKEFGISPGAGGQGFNGFTPTQQDDYLNHMKSIGVQVIRFDHWDGGAGDDQRDAAVQAHGMDAIVLVANGNFANAKAIATTAFRHGFHKYELGNEPNINLGAWGNSVQNYVNAENAAYAAIKSVDSQAIVSTGGICPYGQWGVKSADGSHWDQQAFFAQLLADGAKFDVVATHPYFFGDGYTGAQMLDKTNVYSGLAQALYLAHSLKAQLDAAGRTTTPIWFTESGAPSTGYGWSGGVNEQAQADLTAGMIAIVKAEPRVTIHAIYSGKDRTDNAGNREGHFGLWRADWSAKPAVAAFAAAVK